ncbi:nucleoside phosphorylase domain-containing protein [Aspergillus tetrazonus]
MINVLLQVQSLVSPFATIASFHLLSARETDTITSTIETAKEELRSAKQALPVKQRLFLHLFSKTAVGTAFLTHAWYGNNTSGHSRNGEQPPAAQSLTRQFATGDHRRVNARLVEDLVASLLDVFVCCHNSYRHRSHSNSCNVHHISHSCILHSTRVFLVASDKQTGPARVDREQPMVSGRGRVMPAVSRHNTWNASGTTFRGGLIGTFSVGQTLSRRDYTVGLICALHIELAAVRGMLDEIHVDLPVPRSDTNTYILGRMCSHNVLLLKCFRPFSLFVSDSCIRRGEDDQLFQADHKHSSPKGSCSNCNKRFVISRPQRGTESPQIHYGPIASVARVVKDAELRDRLASKLGNLCFEMEAAGLMDNFPCLIIRGISDYADSHKNNHWHGYAAATAAAYAKELLSVIAQEEVENECVISQLY